MSNPGPGSCSLTGLGAVVDAGLVQRRTTQGDPVVIVNQPVQNSVGEGGLSQTHPSDGTAQISLDGSPFCTH